MKLLLTVLIFLALIFPYCSSEINKIKPSAKGDAPAPAMSITSLMSAHGCKNFADTLSASPAEKTFEDNVQGGLTIFCPTEDAMKAFSPKFKNLTADGKQSVLEYHGVPVYQSLSSLGTSNGLMTTLATDGANNYDFIVQNYGQDVTLKTKIVTARITRTVFDKSPVAIFSIDEVLEPVELFKGAPTPAPAPAPTPEADTESPKPAGNKHKFPPAPASPADAPADGPNDKVADSKADNNGGFRYNAGALDKLRVLVNNIILRFSLYEFVIVTGLKCIENEDDFKYSDLSPGSSRDHSEPHVSLKKDIVVPNVEKRNAANALAIVKKNQSFPLHESEKDIPDKDGDPPQSQIRTIQMLKVTML
ncbi:Fasciclin-like arabinogalactan protein 1 [Capsicum chinense]|nr:Fasciclin-like arabinogalactan protein 1 [Capsicum chinense]